MDIYFPCSRGLFFFQIDADTFTYFYGYFCAKYLKLQVWILVPGMFSVGLLSLCIM